MFLFGSINQNYSLLFVMHCSLCEPLTCSTCCPVIFCLVTFILRSTFYFVLVPITFLYCVQGLLCFNDKSWTVKWKNKQLMLVKEMLLCTLKKHLLLSQFKKLWSWQYHLNLMESIPLFVTSVFKQLSLKCNGLFPFWTNQINNAYWTANFGLQA